MAFNLTYANLTRTGVTLVFTVERLSDGFFFDFSDSTFKSFGSITGTNYRGTLTEGSGIQLGSWTGLISSTPEAQFSDGTYRVRIHNVSDSDKTIAAGEQEFHNGDEVRLDADILDVVGEDGDVTVHQKLGSYSGGSGTGGNVKDDLAGMGPSSVAISVLAGEFVIIADLEKTGASTQDQLDLSVRREHGKRWSFSLKTLDGVALNLTSTRVRFYVQPIKGQGQTATIDYNSVTHPTKVDVYDPTNGKFRVILSDTDTDISETGGDGNGAYAMELLWDRNMSGSYELLVGGHLIIEVGADLLVA